MLAARISRGVHAVDALTNRRPFANASHLSLTHVRAYTHRTAYTHPHSHTPSNTLVWCAQYNKRKVQTRRSGLKEEMSKAITSANLPWIQSLLIEAERMDVQEEAWVSVGGHLFCSSPSCLPG